MATIKKSNVLRLLEAANIPFTAHTFDGEGGKVGAEVIAEKLQIPPEIVFKTLVTTTTDKHYFVFAIPACCTLDLKKAAHAAGVKSLDMLPLAQLFTLTGYLHGGCSPLGMKRLFPTFIDETATLYDKFYISGGHIGLNVEVDPLAFAQLIPATFADLTRL